MWFHECIYKDVACIAIILLYYNYNDFLVIGDLFFRRTGS